MYSYFVIILAIVIVGILAYKYFTKSEPRVECVCVFDLDDTLTCGIPQAKQAIDTCRKNYCKFAINTARNSTYLEDIQLKELGLNPSEFVNDYYIGDWMDKNSSFVNHDNLIEYIAQTKVKHLQTISNKYKVPKDKVILFDDNDVNIKIAKENGFSVIHANSRTCGLNSDVSEHIEYILEK